MPVAKSKARWPLAEAIAVLAKMYGRPRRPARADPFEIVLRESCAYLVDDARRAEVFARLRTKVGLTPRAILGAPEPALLDVVAGAGMRPADRAARLKACAAVAEEIGMARLRKAVRTDPVAARKLIKKFPGFADPGADRILLYNGSMVTLAPDSNALRVLVRLGFSKVEKDYGRMYRNAAAAVAGDLPTDFRWLVAARELLRRHGQELCKRNGPRCEVCPLSGRCVAFHTGSFFVA